MPMDIPLTDEQRMLVDSLRAFMEEEMLPFEDEVDRSGEVPPERGERIR